MKSITVSTELLIKCNNLFSDRKQYIYDWHVKWINEFGHHVDEEEGKSSEDNIRIIFWKEEKYNREMRQKGRRRREEWDTAEEVTEEKHEG